MSVTGLLTADRIAYSMPAAGGLYPEPWTHYRNVMGITVQYETDLEAVQAVVPDVLEVHEPATVGVSVLHIPDSSLGSYKEVQVSVLVRWEDVLRRYHVVMYVTEDVPLTLGRELLGAPKKLADVELRREPGAFVGTIDRPKGVRLATALVAPDTLVDPADISTPLGNSLLLRVLSHPNGSKHDKTMELIETPSDYQVLELWTGRAGYGVGIASDLDPLYRLPVRKLLSGSYMRMDITAPVPNVVHAW